MPPWTLNNRTLSFQGPGGLRLGALSCEQAHGPGALSLLPQLEKGESASSEERFCIDPEPEAWSQN